jgi:MoaA/NifB/PqqE/SkfB family radical SAM enzyme
MRTDICQIIQGIREQNRNSYLGLSTNGWLLNRDIGEQLLAAGLDQLNISIDFLSHEHDEHRGIEGLFSHIERIIPELKDLGIHVVITTSIMKENMNSLQDILEMARSWGVKVGFSCYSALKTGDVSQNLYKEDIKHLRKIIGKLRHHRRKYDTIKTSDFFLRKIPVFFENGTVGKCRATGTWLYLTPDGYLKICPDKNIYAHHKKYKGPYDINCGDCWYTCRGEMEVPFWERIIWMFGDAITSRIGNVTDGGRVTRNG